MAEPQFRFRDDEAVEDAMVTVDAFVAVEFGQANASAVRIEPGDEPRALLPHLERLRLVEVNFPAFTDGRGLSAARILREAGYGGELRAVGEVLVDQLAALRRCGFDSFAPEVPMVEEDARAALARWPAAYQPAADGRVPLWVRRHGDGA